MPKYEIMFTILKKRTVEAETEKEAIESIEWDWQGTDVSIEIIDVGVVNS